MILDGLTADAFATALASSACRAPIGEVILARLADSTDSLAQAAAAAQASGRGCKTASTSCPALGPQSRPCPDADARADPDPDTGSHHSGKAGEHRLRRTARVPCAALDLDASERPPGLHGRVPLPRHASARRRRRPGARAARLDPAGRRAHGDAAEGAARGRELPLLGLGRRPGRPWARRDREERGHRGRLSAVVGVDAEAVDERVVDALGLDLRGLEPLADHRAPRAGPRPSRAPRSR